MQGDLTKKDGTCTFNHNSFCVANVVSDRIIGRYMYSFKKIKFGRKEALAY